MPLLTSIHLITFLELVRIQPNCHGTIVPDFDEHFCLELSALDLEPGCLKRLGKGFDEWGCDFGTGGGDKIGAASAARIGIKCELGDDENFSIHIERAEIEFALSIFKNPQVGDFLSEKFRGGRRVLMRDSNQNDESASNVSNR